MHIVVFMSKLKLPVSFGTIPPPDLMRPRKPPLFQAVPNYAAKQIYETFLNWCYSHSKANMWFANLCISWIHNRRSFLCLFEDKNCFRQLASSVREEKILYISVTSDAKPNRSIRDWKYAPWAQIHDAGTFIAMTWSRVNAPGWAITTLLTWSVEPRRTHVAIKWETCKRITSIPNRPNLLVVFLIFQ